MEKRTIHRFVENTRQKRRALREIFPQPPENKATSVEFWKTPLATYHTQMTGQAYNAKALRVMNNRINKKPPAMPLYDDNTLTHTHTHAQTLTYESQLPNGGTHPK